MSPTKKAKLAAADETPADNLYDSNDSDDDMMSSVSDADKGRSEPIQGRFIGKHPDIASHTVKLKVDDKLQVPMFLGGPLPRHDRGNREDYCMTMLTLFKPWRTRLDLKGVNDRL